VGKTTFSGKQTFRRVKRTKKNRCRECASRYRDPAEKEGLAGQRKSKRSDLTAGLLKKYELEAGESSSTSLLLALKKSLLEGGS